MLPEKLATLISNTKVYVAECREQGDIAQARIHMRRAMREMQREIKKDRLNDEAQGILKREIRLLERQSMMMSAEQELLDELCRLTPAQLYSTESLAETLGVSPREASKLGRGLVRTGLAKRERSAGTDYALTITAATKAQAEHELALRRQTG